MGMYGGEERRGEGQYAAPRNDNNDYSAIVAKKGVAERLHIDLEGMEAFSSSSQFADS